MAKGHKKSNKEVRNPMAKGPTRTNAWQRSRNIMGIRTA